MPITLGRNLSSLQAQRRLFETDQKLGTVFERLSSGQRINSASDDPAGLSVSMKLDTDSRVLNRGRANLNDGISALNLVDGYLSEVSSLVTRMQELAQQAANGSLSNEQRASLNAEYVELDKEIRRVGETAEFNDISLLRSGEFSRSTFIAFDGTAPIANVTLDITSRNARYAELYLGASSADTFSVYDTELDQSYGIDMSGVDPGFGAITTADLLVLTNDGRAIVEGKLGTGESNLYSVNLATGEATRLTDGLTNDVLNDGGVALSADESTLVFASQTLYEDGGSGTSSSGTGSGYRLYSLNLNDGTIRTDGQDLTGYVDSAIISADGSKVAYSVTSDSDFYYQDFSGSELTTAVNYDDLLAFSGPNLTPVGIRDSGEVIFYSDSDLSGNGNANFELFSINSSTGTAVQLTDFNTVSKADALQLSSDGTVVTFVSDESLTGQNPDAQDQVYRLDLSTGLLEQLTDFASGDPAFTTLRMSEDGQTVIGDDLTNEDGVVIRITEDDVNVNLEAGTGATGSIDIAIDSLRDTIGSLGQNVLTSQAAALDAVDDADTALESLNVVRGTIGAGLSRLDTAERVAGSQATELDTASARIVDADIAAEAAELTMLNILRNASTAVLAQANQQAELSLVLLSEQGSFGLGGGS